MLDSAKPRYKQVFENVTEYVAMAFVTLMTLVSTLRLLGILS